MAAPEKEFIFTSTFLQYDCKSVEFNLFRKAMIGVEVAEPDGSAGISFPEQHFPDYGKPLQ